MKTIYNTFVSLCEAYSQEGEYIMAKPVKRNRKPIKKVDVLNLPEGIYLDEKGFGEIHPLSSHRAVSGEPELVYEGPLHKGKIGLVTGKDLKVNIPSLGYDHGYTLEGKAQEIFVVDNGLDIYSPSEKRTFCYINPSSSLVFIGDPSKKYRIYFRIYENCYGNNNNRWVVINAEIL